MKKVNLARVIVGGILAGTIINVSEWVLHDVVMREEFRSHLGSLGRTNPEDVATVVWWNVWGYILGFTAIWLYAAIRPRYGAGAGTAIIAGVAVWVMAHLWSGVYLGMGFMGLIPPKLAYLPVAWGLGEAVLGALAGAWLYKE